MAFPIFLIVVENGHPDPNKSKTYFLQFHKQKPSFREALDLACVVFGALAGQEAKVTVARSLELAVRHCGVLYPTGLTKALSVPFCPLEPPQMPTRTHT